MTDLFEEPEGATPLPPEERVHLLQSWITTRADLNEAEQKNILAATAWIHRSPQRKADLLSEDFIKKLHKKMFGNVWKWAGQYRQREVNIGNIDPYHIPNEMAVLLNEMRWWVEHETFSPDETAIRLHHKMVLIHPFMNGNGRHTRMMADLLIVRMSRPPFTWGSGNLSNEGELRTDYLAALRAADQHDLTQLLLFARS